MSFLSNASPSMTAQPMVWHGDQTEAFDLQTAIQHNCQCEFKGLSRQRTRTCAPHLAMMESQRFVDGLLFARRMAARLKQEEGLTDG